MGCAKMRIAGLGGRDGSRWSEGGVDRSITIIGGGLWGGLKKIDSGIC